VTDVDTIETEEVAQSTRAEATERAERIRTAMVAVVTLPDEVKAAWASRDWVVLGYRSWDDYIAEEFGEHRLPMLTRQQRRELVADLREGGLSTRAIGSVVGVAQRTVVNDIRASVEQNCSTDSTPKEPVADGSAPGPTTMITGANGRPYPSSRPATPGFSTPQLPTEPIQQIDDDNDVIDAEIVDDPPPTPDRKANRRPITDAFRDATYDLIKVVERVERLVLDDRYPRNAEQVARISRGDLLRAADLLAAVVDRISKPIKEDTQ
jgi:hypothetical protein